MPRATGNKPENDAFLAGLTPVDLPPELSDEEVQIDLRKKRAEDRAYQVKRMKEPVTIQLHRDNNENKDDVTPMINGNITQIMRGKIVTVSRAVAENIQQSLEADMSAMEMSIRSRNVNLSADEG